MLVTYEMEHIINFIIRNFTLPSVESREDDDYENVASWGDENMFGGQYDDGNYESDVEDSSTLVSQPRQVFTF